jgi:hypothetical protein
MKKLILLAMLLFGTMTFAQEKAFVKKYNYSILENSETFNRATLTVVFNYNGTKDVMFYFPATQLYLYRVSEVTEGKTKSGNPYQMVDCINSDGGQKVTLQLFDNGVLRVFMGADYIEYHQD